MLDNLSFSVSKNKHNQVLKAFFSPRKMLEAFTWLIVHFTLSSNEAFWKLLSGSHYR
jgi:hypothetical protein